MELILYLKGIIIGYLLAIPVGPIGLICIRKTIAGGKTKGTIVGLGAATADMIYAGIAALGVTMVSKILFSQQTWIRLSGAAVIIFLGVRTFLAKPLVSSGHSHEDGTLKLYSSTLLLTLTNPFTIFAFIAVFAALGLGNGLSSEYVFVLMSGVFTGSGLWFLTLSTGVSLFRKKIGQASLELVNRITGVLIILSAVLSIATLL